MGILPILAMCFMVTKGFVYAIAVDIYAYRIAFCCILTCVLQQITLHLAAFYLAFCTKMPCV